MPERSYSAADIQVLEFDEAVRARPGMYFGMAREDQALATRVFCCVLVHALHPAARLAPAHTARVYADISADLTFSVTDDQVGPVDERGIPRPGYYGSLLGADRWMLAAAAVVSSRAVAEVWQGGRGFRQVFRPVTVSDSTDGFIAHLHGLNLTRAWCWRRLAETLGDTDPRTVPMMDAARRHTDASLTHATGSHYAVEHYLACYAVLLLS